MRSFLGLGASEPASELTGLPISWLCFGLVDRLADLVDITRSELPWRSPISLTEEASSSARTSSYARAGGILVRCVGWPMRFSGVRSKVASFAVIVDAKDEGAPADGRSRKVV